MLGELEDLRDERLSKIISMFQAFCKGYLMRKEYKKMCDQRWAIFGETIENLSREIIPWLPWDE